MTDVDPTGGRHLVLHHVTNLRGYPVCLVEADTTSNHTIYEFDDIELRDPFC